MLEVVVDLLSRGAQDSRVLNVVVRINIDLCRGAIS